MKSKIFSFLGICLVMILSCNKKPISSVSADENSNGTPDGNKLKELINCYTAHYMTDAASRPNNSKTEGCDSKTIIYCKTDKGNNDHMCKFDGTNKLKDSSDTPNCYYNCQMETCNAWESPKGNQQEECVKKLSEAKNGETTSPDSAQSAKPSSSSTSASSASSEGVTGLALYEAIRDIIARDPNTRKEAETKPFMGSFSTIKKKDDAALAETGYCMTDNHCGHFEAYSQSGVPLSSLSCNKFCYFDPNEKKYKTSKKYSINNPPKNYLCCGWETCAD
ncbi:MAG: hypothetical protein HQK54_15110 [Oligoflexales bacterium]|nr:hypothetical protein [Oligoflexales bacterium]